MKTDSCVYLDYAATTPVDPVVAEAMAASLTTDFGNPASTTHVFGARAAAHIETARAQIAALIGARPSEILLTSGATESNNLAILGYARANAGRGRHLVTARTEHKAVLDPCKRLEKEGFRVTYLTPARTGQIAAEAVVAAMQADTVLVSIMHANNETGVLQDVTAIGQACRERGIAFHSDAAQSAGKEPLDVGTMPVDLLSFTAHKLYGPKGVGALYVRGHARALLQAVSFGGGQERGLRPGTLPTHQIVGFGTACNVVQPRMPAEQARLRGLRDRLWEGISGLGGCHLNGAGAPRLAGLLNVSFEAVAGESLIAGLRELALATGSACNSASEEPSYVLRALGRDRQLAEASLRFSIGRFTREQDIQVAIEAVNREVRRLRAVSPAWPCPIGVQQPPDEGEWNEAVTHPPDDLGALATRYFRRLPLGGTFSACDSHRVVTGEGGGSGQDAWVRFHLRVGDGIVKDARFEALGCPHTLAVAAWIAEQLPTRRRESLVPGEPHAWARALAVPTEKLGRLLAVEDALRAALRHWS